MWLAMGSKSLDLAAFFDGIGAGWWQCMDSEASAGGRRLLSRASWTLSSMRGAWPAVGAGSSMTVAPDCDRHGAAGARLRVLAGGFIGCNGSGLLRRGASRFAACRVSCAHSLYGDTVAPGSGDGNAFVSDFNVQ